VTFRGFPTGGRAAARHPARSRRRATQVFYESPAHRGARRPASILGAPPPSLREMTKRYETWYEGPVDRGADRRDRRAGVLHRRRGRAASAPRAPTAPPPARRSRRRRRARPKPQTATEEAYEKALAAGIDRKEALARRALRHRPQGRLRILRSEWPTPSLPASPQALPPPVPSRPPAPSVPQPPPPQPPFLVLPAASVTLGADSTSAVCIPRFASSSRVSGPGHLDRDGANP
jgi:hypothetical protein